MLERKLHWTMLERLMESVSIIAVKFEVHWQESNCAESGAGSDQGLGMSNLLFRWGGLLKATRKIDL